ncbi:amino acid ABC transporter permease [Sanguibacter antarcticus]|uniref:Amino acid ABC transporter membrane protein (PAAT family) n=1 Tax=Sanguibacter antarcticus TaxID=372484 RepID=A0A2A9E5U8_9MICO|nr:amino acid ABC transporter permease [Sanguibacter antarcticus]PFG33602.1 amino acid ABC transporter membrane protein (PAAT family) [Sanguibacter antarcticus]
MTTEDSTVARHAPRRARLSPRRRARIFRGIQYAILVVAVVGIFLLIDWDRISESVFNIDAAKALLPRVPLAFKNTVVYTAASFAIGLSLGTVLALMKLSSVAPYRWIATAYIEFFRGIPALLVVFSFGYAVPIALGVRIDSLTLKAALALGLVSAAYIAETLRAGIQAVPRGQVEAARSLGMSSGRTLATVVIPQAFRIVLPPMTNEIILLTKDTSLIFVLGLAASQFDLTKIGRDALVSAAGGGTTGLFVAGFGYLCITIPLGLLARWLENRTGKKSRR